MVENNESVNLSFTLNRNDKIMTKLNVM